MEKVWDVIIVGAGPAGLTAGIYTARHGYRTLLLYNDKIGGRANEAHLIENYPGFPKGLTGADLMKLFHQQAAKFSVEFKHETVIGLADACDYKIVSTQSGYHKGKTIILATGIQRKQPSIPGEKEFKGRGVSYCAICDGPFFKDKVVAVVGSGHGAVADALHLIDIAKKVYAIPGAKGYNESYVELSLLRSNPKVEIIDRHDVAEIVGNEFVTKIKLIESKVGDIEVDGVFILFEHVSTSNILVEAGVDFDEGGCVIVDKGQQTNIPGVFAAGDCSCMGWQVVTAAGDGAKAAISAMKYIKKVGRHDQN